MFTYSYTCYSDWFLLTCSWSCISSNPYELCDSIFHAPHELSTWVLHINACQSLGLNGWTQCHVIMSEYDTNYHACHLIARDELMYVYVVVCLFIIRVFLHAYYLSEYAKKELYLTGYSRNHFYMHLMYSNII